MSFVLVTAPEVHYGPTCISTEDGTFHQQIENELTITTKPPDKMDKSEKSRQKLEAKMKDKSDKHDKPDKAEKVKAKMDKYLQRKSGIESVIDGKNIKFDPTSKAYLIKVDDAPVRVLNKLAKIGFQMVPSASGSGIGHFRAGHVWTLYRHAPPPAYAYPNLGQMNVH